MKNDKLKVSIITVTYNCKSVILDCLNSVASQSYKNIEHIIIDGASTDGTLTLLKSKSEQFSQLISEPDSGIYEAMNKGIELAKGDIIGFLNSDDFYENNNVISKVIRVFNDNPSLDACYADLKYVDRINISKVKNYFKSSKFVQGSFFKGWFPPHPTFFVHRSVYNRYGKFNLNYNIAADIDLMLRFLEINKIHVQYIPEFFIKMRTGGASYKNYLESLNEIKNIKLKYHGSKIRVYFDNYYSIFKHYIKIILRKY